VTATAWCRRAGSPETAVAVIREPSQYRVFPNRGSFHALIQACGLAGKGDLILQALECLKQRTDTHANEETYAVAIRCVQRTRLI
jgi:hypothetical protein